MKNILLALGCATMVTVGLGSADAHPRARAACKADVARFCKGIRPGHGRILACLRSHLGQLSPKCKAAMKGARDKIRKAKKDCGADARRFCKGIRPGHGRIHACLKSHYPELSPECKAHFKPPKGRGPLKK